MNSSVDERFSIPRLDVVASCDFPANGYHVHSYSAFICDWSDGGRWDYF